jgi:hypothetical protein
MVARIGMSALRFDATFRRPAKVSCDSFVSQATHSRQGRALLPCEIIELAEETMNSSQWQENCHSQYRKSTMGFLESKIVKAMADYREFLGLERGDAPENLEHGDAIDIGAEREQSGTSTLFAWSHFLSWSLQLRL